MTLKLAKPTRTILSPTGHACPSDEAAGREARAGISEVREPVETAPIRRVSALIGSSRYRALSDDALKDEDNAAWVLTLPADVQRAWLDRIHWIRLVDRLAENEQFEPRERRFGTFIDAWRVLLVQGTVDPNGPFARELSAIRTLWCMRADDARAPGRGIREGGVPAHADGDALARLSITAWDAYLHALAPYHAPDLQLTTLREHDIMLWRLSGRIFQLVPFLTEELWDAAGEFGRLDQFFNNLRDMQEDADRGICYFPADVLSRFGVTRRQVVSGRCIDEPGYQRLMRFWLDEYLHSLFARAASFIGADGLHPSLALMRAWSLRRYERILRVFRATEFDYRRFPARYWAEVRRDLVERKHRLRAQPA